MGRLRARGPWAPAVLPPRHAHMGKGPGKRPRAVTGQAEAARLAALVASCLECGPSEPGRWEFCRPRGPSLGHHGRALSNSSHHGPQGCSWSPDSGAARTPLSSP